MKTPANMRLGWEGLVRTNTLKKEQKFYIKFFFMVQYIFRVLVKFVQPTLTFPSKAMILT